MHNYTKYFKEQKGFDRFIHKLYEKYRSLSKFSGTIKLANLKEEESSTLSRFFGTTYQKNSTISIPIKKFISIMENSKYEDFDIGILVEEYLDIKLITISEEKDTLSKEENQFYQEIIKDNNSIGNIWLKEVIINKIAPYKLIHQRYIKNKISLHKELINILNLINNLPHKKILLPIFASTYTKDPHYLDIVNNHSILFFYALSHIDNLGYPITREDKIKLLSKYNIEIDNISNFAITYNLLTNKDYINKFSENKESLILNIQNIISTDYFTTKSKEVFILENPSLLTEIISRNIDASIIIADGFPNTSVHLLIEKLIKSGNKLYYNGDFDPEGLLIAEKLKERYKDNLELFCYSINDYNSCISKEKISETRLKKLSKVNTSELIEVKKLLLENKCSAYQENNKDRIIRFIKKENRND